MSNKFSEDFYIFCTPKDNPDSNSYIKIIDPGCPFMGVVFVVNYIKLKKTLFKGYKLKYDYSIIESPEDGNVNMKDTKFGNLVGDIIMDIWDKYYT